jgi:hypothetical protein
MIFNVNAHYDKTEVANGIELKSGKKKDTRIYLGRIEKKIPFPIEIVKSSVTNFSQKCNNEYKAQRKYSSTKEDCKYHNDNLIETFVVNPIKINRALKNFTQAYVLGRRIYNRGNYGYYELVTIQEEINVNKQKTIKIIARMLKDEEVKSYISPQFKRESVFNESKNLFILTQISPTETKFEYEYSASTKHWILNKEVSTPRVFSSMGKSIKDLMKSVEDESSLLKKALVSK